MKMLAKLLGPTEGPEADDAIESMRAERRAWVEALIAEIAVQHPDQSERPRLGSLHWPRFVPESLRGLLG